MCTLLGHLSFLTLVSKLGAQELVLFYVQQILYSNLAFPFLVRFYTSQYNKHVVVLEATNDRFIGLHRTITVVWISE